MKRNKRNMPRAWGALLGAILIIGVISYAGCVTFTPVGIERVNDIMIFSPSSAPANYTTLGIINTTYIEWFADFTKDHQALASQEAVRVGANGLIQLDKNTYEAIQF